MTIFEEIKSRTDIKEVAELFGVKINKHNKSLCFVHSESNPSLSFKGDYYKCFSCGASGDVITMVSHIRGVQPIEAARIIDSIYGFNLFDNKGDLTEIRQQIKQVQADRQIIESFKQWESHAFLVLSNRYWELREKSNVILKPTDPHLQRHIAELAELPFIEYLLDTMIQNTSDLDKQVEFYKLWKGTVSKYAQCTTSRTSA